MTDAVNIKNLCFHYPDGTAALENVNIEIKTGTKTAILGPNGAGKSTLLLQLNGIKLPSSGEVYVLGQKVGKENLKSIRTKVGLVFQDPEDQVFSSSVYEDVAFGPRNLKLPPDEIEKRVRYALETVKMAEFSHRDPNTLSFGQKKRAAIAGVLAMEPDIIVLDEPLAYLDPAGQDELFEVLESMNSQGKTIIMATHDVDLAAQWADNVIVMVSGQVIARGGRNVLADEEVVKKANLRLPMTARMFKSMGIIEGLPVTIDEAISMLKDFK